MGKHASDPNDDGDKGDGPRVGVGNLDLTEDDFPPDIEDSDGDKAHPSENADVLRELCESGVGSENQCP